MNCHSGVEQRGGRGGGTPRAAGGAAGAFGPASRFRRSRSAFSLLEVMIAGGIFFMAIFAILAMVSSVLRNARSLRRADLDAGMVAAQVCNTNKLYEGSQSGDFGNWYPGCSWEAETYEAATNGLFQVDITVHRRGLRQPVDSISIFLFRPDSPRRP